MKKTLAILVLSVFLLFAIGAVAQEHQASQPPAASESHPAAAQPEAPNQAIDKDLSAASESALHGNPEQEEEEEYVQLKQSPSVRWIAKTIGVSPKAAYWILFSANFLILIGAIIWFSRSSIPAMMKNRTSSIQKGIEEARKASAEASARLSEIEARLSKLDGEVAEIRAAAEADFSVEESRIKKQAEEDARHVIESVEQEITAATRSAQRELKAYVAELAVNLAQKKISVDAKTDEALVRDFVSQLGKDGK